MDLTAAASAHRARLRSIKLLVFDVDGVLTDGTIQYVGGDIGWTRRFHTGDGFGIKLMQRLGFETALISADDNRAMLERAAMLGIGHTFFGSEDKRGAWTTLLERTGRTERETLYIADELFDLPLLKRAGFSAAPPNAAPEVLSSVHYVTQRSGGRGAVREVLDLVRIAQGVSPGIEGFDG